MAKSGWDVLSKVRYEARSEKGCMGDNHARHRGDVIEPSTSWLIRKALPQGACWPWKAPRLDRDFQRRIYNSSSLPWKLEFPSEFNPRNCGQLASCDLTTPSLPASTIPSQKERKTQAESTKKQQLE